MDYASLDYLKSKILSYSPEHAEVFHGSALKAFPNKAQYIWESANNDRFGGFVYYGPKLAAYLNANGEEYILSSHINTIDFTRIWNLNCQLYNKSIHDSKFRMVQPLGFANGFAPRTFKTININGEKFNYYLLFHPNNDLGNLIYFDKDILPEVLIETFIENTDILLGHLYSILGESPQYPNLKFNDLLINDDGVYWRFLYSWDLPKEGFIAKLDGELEKALQTAVHNNFELDMSLLDIGNAKWKKTLNI